MLQSACKSARLKAMSTSMHAVSSLDGYIADHHDGVGHLHDWYFNGEFPILDDDGTIRISAASIDYVRKIWATQKVLIIGRHQFDLTNGWDGHPPASNHVVVVSHRPKPEGWHPEASYHFVTSIEAAFQRAEELAEGGDIGVTAGDIGGQALALGLIDHVAMDIVPVVFGGGKPYFGAFADADQVLGDPDVVIQGQGVLHLRYPVRKG
jgi:dihydrofolate reductase